MRSRKERKPVAFGVLSLKYTIPLFLTWREDKPLKKSLSRDVTRHTRINSVVPPTVVGRVLSDH